jgi:hypothetical protein
VIPNRFGPLEEPRFTAYLMKTWLAGEVARAQTQRYVRDSIHVSLLAKTYAAFVGAARRRVWCATSTRAATRKVRAPSPSACAARRPHALGPPGGLEFGVQSEFDEPPVRINTNLPKPA